MTTSQVTVRTLAALTLVVGFAAAARAQPAPVTVEWALKQTPKQPGVNVSTPPAAGCRIAPVLNPDPKAGGKSMGSLLKGPDDKPVRQFVSYDDKSFNIIVYYLDGVEAYREVYMPDPKEPFQFRWVGPNGTKWGLDRNRDGVIDEWAVISPEEVSQEVAAALAANDPKRLAALVVTRENLAGLGLPAADVNQALARASGVPKRLADTAAALKLSDKARWLHVEYGIPSVRPADAFNGREDYTAYKNGTVFVEDGGKGVPFQMGELVQIGRAWKLVDGPAPGAAVQQVNAGGAEAAPVPDEIRTLVEKLNDHDKTGSGLTSPQEIAKFNAVRAGILEEINSQLKDESKKETWIKMLLDSHAAAAEGDKAGNKHLVRIDQFKKAYSAPGANAAIASYAAFRLILAENAVAMANLPPNGQLGPIQDKWRESLEEFVKAYPQSTDAPEALWRLAMAHEHSGAKDGEAKARAAFEALAKGHANTAQGLKAAGALKRYDAEGKPLELVGTVLGTTQPFNAAQPGKVVVLYYWASWSQSLPEDAKKLQSLMKEYEGKGLAVVTVSVDHDPKVAAEAAKKVGLPGTHLFAEGGLDGSALAAAYGILAPPHAFVVGRDGKIVNRKAQVQTLEDDLKKLFSDK
ncbi:redoxin domain-containing protein [Gemmata sp. JC673]|uniref:Redoxin domain-containing protein n=1 Tax=Gemmata algarum TaxID=2975278 RepID=A0ABU5F162_9BACT|nr:redoxin domain-containing protein [Gemmata algarum]MDY3561322.1 redoxin domain-containing protein [Gemmata algarum]